ncbi:MAG: hypothetical protein M0021_04375 [Clostridia bacterium]|nr:hypothetical protein [Clostridia bacterium]
MSDKVGIFIDGAYLDKILQDEFGSPRIDYEKLAGWMSQGIPIFRTYYYHCLPYQGNPPTPWQSADERIPLTKNIINSILR